MVQGVGFRPFVYRLAHENTLSGWVLNDEEGVEIHLEGAERALDAFVNSMDDRGGRASKILRSVTATTTAAPAREFRRIYRSARHVSGNCSTPQILAMAIRISTAPTVVRVIP